MSDQDQFGEKSVEADQGFTSMSDAYAAPEEKRKNYGADESGIRQAAEDLTEARARTEPEPTVRAYGKVGGDDHGKPAGERETVSLNRASDDLVRQRGFEQAAQQRDPAAYQAAVDNFRHAFPKKELPPDLVQQINRAAEQPQQAQQTDYSPSEVNDAARAQMAAEQTQPVEQPHPQDGIDPEIQAALQNPKIRQALEAEVQAAEQARIQFSQAALQASRMAAAALLSQHPELASLSAAELPHALSESSESK
jgi:hypothetical protein